MSETCLHGRNAAPVVKTSDRNGWFLLSLSVVGVTATVAVLETVNPLLRTLGPKTL